MTVHPTATIEDGAVIGESTDIWHHVHIRTGARVGSGDLGKNVLSDGGAVIGDRCKVQNNVSIYNGVTIGNDVFVGPSAVFTNDMWPRANATGWTITPTTVNDGASIGANATIICGVEIGSFATVGAGSVVTRDVADQQLVVGNPARPHGWVCRCGRLASRLRRFARPSSPVPNVRVTHDRGLVGRHTAGGRGARPRSTPFGDAGQRAQGRRTRGSPRLRHGRHPPCARRQQRNHRGRACPLEPPALQPGDEVITKPFTFVATVNAILESGATVRFADIGDDFYIDPDWLPHSIGPSQGVLPVHLYGQPADMAPLAGLAKPTASASSRTPRRAMAAATAGRRSDVGGWVLQLLRHQERHHRRRRNGHH